MAARVSVASEPRGSYSLQPTNRVHDGTTAVRKSLAPIAVTGTSGPGRHDAAINAKSSGDSAGVREPPTEPRFMRRNNVPLPSQPRATAHRVIDRRTQHDVYRPSSFCLADLVNRASTVGSSVTWRSNPFHSLDDTAHGSGPQSSSSRTSEHMSGTQVRRSQLESSPDQPTDKGEILSPSRLARRADEDYTARLTRILNGSNVTPGDMLIKAFLETPLDIEFMREEINQGPAEKRRGRNSQQGSHDLSNRDKGTALSGLAFASATNMGLEANANSTPKFFGPKDRSSPTTQTTDLGSDIGQSLSSVDPTPFSSLRPHKEMGSAFDKGSITGGSKFSRFSKEETASSTSTINSRTKSLCRECRTPGSALTPLVTCTSCDRRYHHSCGNPKPPKGPSANDFVCGKCLKKKRLDRASEELSRPTPVNPDILTSDPTIQATYMSKALTAEPASHLHMNDEDHDAAKIQSSQGDLYKLITCHYWKQGRCNLYENHCLFAHVETGQESPSGRNPAKAFTCPTWKAHHCGKSSDECLYSHEDTGLYVGFNNDVLRKHITCYYWKVSGSCRHYEQDCSYAHRDTGILAWQPAKDAQSAPGKNSLKNYMCPRWESNQTCMWYPINCPYNHSPTALSCHRSATESRRNVRQVEHSPDWESEPVLGPSPSTYVSQVMPPFSMDGVKERKNKHRDAQKDETCTAVAGVQLHTPAIAPGASRITPTRDDPPAIRHHPFTGRHMAKRGGRTVRNLPSKQSSGTALNNSLRSPSQDQHNQHNSSIRDSASTVSATPHMAKAHMTTDIKWPGTPDFSGTAGDTSAKSLAGNRVKKCEKCERRILGSANRCFSCATTDATHNEDDSRALGGRSNAVDLELSDLAIPKVFPAQKMSQNEYGFDESSRRLVARVLKRAAQDDDLFVSRKRLKISTLPMNSQTALSVSSNNLPSVPVTLKANAEKLLARSRQFPADSTNLPSLQNELGIQKEGNSCGRPTVPNMEGEAASVQQQSLSPHNIHDASSYGEIIHEARGLSRLARALSLFNDRETRTSASRPQSPAKVGIAQSSATEIPKTPSSGRLPPTSLSKSTSAMEKGNAQSLEKTQAPGELHAEFFESDNQPHDARTSRALVSDDNHWQDESVKSAAKHRVNSSAKSAEANRWLGISDNTELNTSPTQESGSLSTLKARCEACRAAHRKCLHRPGGTRDDLDPLKCATFLAENPERPLNGKFPQSYWLKIKQAASLHHQASNSLSVSKYREKALKVAVALGVTETSDESMVDAIEYVAAETGPIGRFASKVNLTPRLNSEHPRLRSRARAAAIEDPLRDSGGDSNDDLPLAIIRRRNRPKDHRSSLEHAAMPVTLTLGNSNEQGNRLDPFAKRPTGTRHPRPQHGKARPGWTDDEEQRALERLRERGVKIETDSDSDELLSDDDAPRQAPALVTDRLHRVLESQNPFDVDSSLDLRNPENRYQALGKIPPWNRNRPTKKQLMGNLLLYQCRDNKLKFGNPHYNVMRKSREVLVNAIIEKDDVLNSPDECSGREPEIQQVPMTFREFIGMPKQATITRGKSKDELTFVERLNHTDRSLLGASTRTRRYRDDEVFPFIKG